MSTWSTLQCFGHFLFYLFFFLKLWFLKFNVERQPKSTFTQVLHLNSFEILSGTPLHFDFLTLSHFANKQSTYKTFSQPNYGALTQRYLK